MQNLKQQVFNYLVHGILQLMVYLILLGGFNFFFCFFLKKKMIQEKNGKKKSSIFHNSQPYSFSFTNDLETTVISSANAIQIHTNLNGPLKIFGNGSNLANFVLKFMELPSISILISGTFDATMITSLGTFEFTAIPISQSASFQGFHFVFPFYFSQKKKKKK